MRNHPKTMDEFVCQGTSDYVWRNFWSSQEWGGCYSHLVSRGHGAATLPTMYGTVPQHRLMSPEGSGAEPLIYLSLSCTLLFSIFPLFPLPQYLTLPTHSMSVFYLTSDRTIMSPFINRQPLYPQTSLERNFQGQPHP
jgi:hypothetical protein